MTTKQKKSFNELRFEPSTWEWKPQSLVLRYNRKYPKMSRVLGKWELWSKPATYGPRDLSDLFAPGQTRAADIPGYYHACPVHQMDPNGHLGGWNHPKMGANQAVVTRDFPFNTDEVVAPWMQKNLIERGITDPKLILDVGCGVGPNAFHFAQLYPNAEIIGIDLAAAMLRYGKQDAARRGLTNVHFYHGDGGDLSLWEDETFDIVHQGACVHEMPADHGRKTYREMLRVLKTGGVMTVFDRGISRTPGDWKLREWYVSSTQEPFLLEYDRFNWPEWMATTLGVTVEENPGYPPNWKWDGSSTSWLITKGPETNRLLKETEFSEADMERIRYAEDAPIKWNMLHPKLKAKAGK